MGRSIEYSQRTPFRLRDAMVAGSILLVKHIFYIFKMI
jgi:hypothetical protein